MLIGRIAWDPDTFEHVSEGVVRSVAPEPDGPGRDALRLLGPRRRDGDRFQAVRDQRAELPRREPPSRDVPGHVGATGLERLDEDSLLTRLEEITELEAMLAAEKAATLAGLAAQLCGVSADLGHDDPLPGDRLAEGAERRWHNGLLRSLADEAGLVLGLQRRAASTRINASIDLVTRFPETLRALSEGCLPERAAFAIADELGLIQDPPTRARAEVTVLDWVDRYGPHRVRRTARREAAKHVAEHSEIAYAAHLEERAVVMRPTDHGIAELALTASALDAAAVMSSLSSAALATRRSGDDRTLDQLRSDIAVRRLLGTADDSTPGVDATVVIHCTADEAVAIGTGSTAVGGELDGYGPLPQTALTDALRTARIRYRLTDREPVGDPERYTPSAALAQHVVDRDRVCQVPGCGHPAIRCDIDHRVEFPDGVTAACNCEALCRHHHRLKHRGGWRVRRLSSGELAWSTPSGRMYLMPAPDD